MNYMNDKIIKTIVDAITDISRRLRNLETRPQGSGGTFVESNKLLVSIDDTTADYGETKIVGGTDIAVNVLNPAGNEQLEISFTGTATSLTVKEEDGSPNVSDVTEIKVSNGRLTDNGSGSVSIDVSGSFALDDLTDVNAPSPTDGDVVTWNNGAGEWQATAPSGGGAPDDAAYVVSTADAGLSAEIVIPSFLSHPDAIPASPNTEDDEFSAGSLDGKWTNENSATISFSGSTMIVNVPSANVAQFYQSYSPGANTAFAITVKFVGIIFWEDIDYFGLRVMDGSGGYVSNLDCRYQGGMLMYSDAGGSHSQAIRNGKSNFYLRIARDASNVYTHSISFDGRIWISPLSTHTTSTTVGRIAFYVGGTAARSWKKGGVDWFRRT